MKSGLARRLPIAAGGIALSTMVWLAAGCSSTENKAPETSTSTTTTTTTTTPATTPPPPPPASPTENAPRAPGGNPFTTQYPNPNDNGRNPNAPRAPQ